MVRDRALSTPAKLLVYGAGTLVALYVVVQVVGFVLGLVTSLLVLAVGLAVTLAVVAGLGYAAWWGLSSLLGDDEQSADAGVDHNPTLGTGADDRVERLRERYADGELTEAEFERRLERALEESGEREVETEYS